VDRFFQVVTRFYEGGGEAPAAGEAAEGTEAATEEAAAGEPAEASAEGETETEVEGSAEASAEPNDETAAAESTVAETDAAGGDGTHTVGTSEEGDKKDSESEE